MSEWIDVPSSREDELGPAWSEPYGCCYGECDTETSIAFREYHGIEEALQEEQRWLEREAQQQAKEWRAKLRGRAPRKRFCELSSILISDRLSSPHELPRRLRNIYFRPATTPKHTSPLPGEGNDK